MLPLANANIAVLIESECTWVINMGVATRRGLLVCLLVEEPMNAGNLSKLGLVPCEVGFNPSDLGELVQLSENALPKICMLFAMDWSPLEGAVEGV